MNDRRLYSMLLVDSKLPEHLESLDFLIKRHLGHKYNANENAVELNTTSSEDEENEDSDNDNDKRTIMSSEKAKKPISKEIARGDSERTLNLDEDEHESDVGENEEKEKDSKR